MKYQNVQLKHLTLTFTENQCSAFVHFINFPIPGNGRCDDTWPEAYYTQLIFQANHSQGGKANTSIDSI